MMTGEKGGLEITQKKERKRQYRLDRKTRTEFGDSETKT